MFIAVSRCFISRARDCLVVVVAGVLPTVSSVCWGQPGVRSDYGNIDLLGGRGSGGAPAQTTNPAPQQPTYVAPSAPQAPYAPAPQPGVIGGGFIIDTAPEEPQITLTRSQAEMALTTGGWATGVERDGFGAITGVRYRKTGRTISIASQPGSEDLLSVQVEKEDYLPVPHFHIPPDAATRAQNARALLQGVRQAKDDKELAESAMQFHSREFHGTTNPAIRAGAASAYQTWDAQRARSTARFEELKILLMALQFETSGG